MKNNGLYDIAKVCNMLKITSRTLRYYEEKGIIKSTVNGTSSRRHYTEEQVKHIRNVLVLRTLGLSINTIAELQAQNADLRDAVLSKRAEIYSFVEKRVNQINLLNEALLAIESGEDIFLKDWDCEPKANKKDMQAVEICTKAIVDGDTETLYQYLSPRMQKFMPRDVYKAARDETLERLGEFVELEKIEVDKNLPNKIYQFVKYKTLGLKITFVFHSGMIDGLWLNYYDIKERR